MRSGTFLSLMLSSLILGGCWDDAQHLNPLDPLSPDYESAGSITGLVSDRGFKPLAGVTVSLGPIGSSTTTSSDGRFTLDGLIPGEYFLTANADGLESVTDTVNILVGSATNRSYSLNAIPQFESTTMSTVHVSRWWPQNDLYRLDVTTEVSDADGLVDLSRVDLMIPHLGFETALQPMTDAGFFGISLTVADLGGSSLHDLLGRPLVLDVTDQFGSVRSSGSVYLSRIIDYIPETAAPTGSQEIPGGSPLLRWIAADTPFNHTYKVDVYRVDDDVDTNVYSQDGIPPSQLTAQVSESFEIGQYYWTISVVDEFGNRSRSKEAGFIVP